MNRLCKKEREIAKNQACFSTASEESKYSVMAGQTIKWMKASAFSPQFLTFSSCCSEEQRVVLVLSVLHINYYTTK